MKISSESLSGLSAGSEALAIERLCDLLVAGHAEEANKLDRNLLTAFVRSRVKMARALGLVSERDVHSFVTLDFQSAGRFAADREVRLEFADPGLPARGGCRVLTVCGRLSPDAWLRIRVTNPPIRWTSQQ